MHESGAQMCADFKQQLVVIKSLILDYCNCNYKRMFSKQDLYFNENLHVYRYMYSMRNFNRGKD